MYKIFAVLGAILVGIAAGLQPSINASLGKVVGPRLAALVNFIVGGTVVVAINLLSGELGKFSLIQSVPWYLLIGGLLGSIIVFGLILTIPVIGSGSALSIVVTLQLLVGMLIDHFGWFGVPRVPIDIGRVAGFILMVIGVILVVR